MQEQPVTRFRLAGKLIVYGPGLGLDDGTLLNEVDEPKSSGEQALNDPGLSLDGAARHPETAKPNRRLNRLVVKRW